MFTHAAIVLGVIAAVFVIASLLKLSIELSMLLAAVAGAIAHGAGIPARQLVDGAFTYFDVVLIFITATFFMTLLRETGGVDFIVRGIIRRFHNARFLSLLLLTLVMLVPGALTGSGTVTVLVVGGLAARVLAGMGIRDDKVTAIVFLTAAMSAAAPPINLWAMMAAAGSNMPYVGFLAPLGVLSVAGALFTVFFLGWKGTPIDAKRLLAELPAPEGMRWWRVALPFAVLFALIVLSRATGAREGSLPLDRFRNSLANDRSDRIYLATDAGLVSFAPARMSAVPALLHGERAVVNNPAVDPQDAGGLTDIAVRLTEDGADMPFLDLIERPRGVALFPGLGC